MSDMNIGNQHYENEVQAALDAAFQLSDPNEAYALRLEALRSLPRFPSLLPLHGKLLAEFVDGESQPTDVALVAECIRWLLHVGRASGISSVVQKAHSLSVDFLESASEASDFSAWVFALTRTAMTAREQGYSNAATVYQQLESKTDALAREDLAVDLALARLDLECQHDHRNATLNALDALETNLEGKGSSWDGERFALFSTQALVFVQRDEHDATYDAMQGAFQLAEAHELPVDLGQVLLGLVPLLIHRGEADKAVEHLESALQSLDAFDGPGELEMALCHLRIKSHEANQNIPDAIHAGFEAVRRSGTKGNIDNYTSFMVHIATLYFQAGAYVDTLHMLNTAERGLRQREDAAHLLEQIDSMKKGLEADLGSERYAEVKAECEQRERSE
jgi:tetratricopeptide (TPR) repeat protein